eukprot:TRINITY_DN1624_c2_g1_i8.p2 TRINITY_DN1624_c2_g1~~TRINITY_DN1624_c2_g1_i8.p2  ORF type:complete len:177 (-),score=45.59 TRINITY_DN1624_c2_g1_i8:383-913(-)
MSILITRAGLDSGKVVSREMDEYGRDWGYCDFTNERTCMMRGKRGERRGNKRGDRGGKDINDDTIFQAVQIFDVLRDIGCEHDKLSAGLLVGGKDVAYEQQFVNNMNILVCTPGRLLQHMDETPGFDCSNLKVLVLDEADRILDMKFEREIQAILENIPEEERQTLLFSATQTKSV